MIGRCPAGRVCPRTPCVYKLRRDRCLRDDLREHTLAEVAAELGVDVSTACRIEATARARVRMALEIFSTDTIGFSGRPCKESRGSEDSG